MYTMRTMSVVRGCLLLGLLTGLAACPAKPDVVVKPPPGVPEVVAATLESRSNSTATGTARFEQVGNQLKVSIQIAGATSGQHGLHIHVVGDCSDPVAKSAGDHFNPAKHEHGGPGTEHKHAGDLGNIVVGEDGKGTVELLTDQLSVNTGEIAIMGRSIVLHEKPDDLTTQPSGNSGVRIACGVIKPL